MSFNPRQQAFIDEYLICRNASRAAKLAGYNGKSNIVGPRLLSNVSIQEEITRRLREKHISADEVLARLADMAYADVRDFVRIESPEDLLKPRYKGKTHVIKKFKKTVITTRQGDVITTTELELHDSRQTLVDLGRYHKLFTDKIQIADWRLELIEAIKQGKIKIEDIPSILGDNDLAREFIESSGLQFAGVREAESEAEITLAD